MPQYQYQIIIGSRDITEHAVMMQCTARVKISPNVTRGGFFHNLRILSAWTVQNTALGVAKDSSDPMVTPWYVVTTC